MEISSQFASLLLSRLPVVFFEIDSNGRLLSVEGEAVKVFSGGTSGQAPKSLYVLAPEHGEEIQAALQPGGKARWVNFGLHDGEPCWTEFLLSFNESRGQGALGIAIDVSDERREDQLGTRLSQSKDRSVRLESMGYLMSLFSSELHNYLSVAAGNLRAVQRHLAGDIHHSHRVQTAFRAMDGATQNSQKLARAIRPRAPELRTLSVRQLLEGAIDWAELNLGKDHDFELIVSDGLPQFNGDEEQISEIVRILLRNAVESMPEGGLTIVECDCIESGARAKKPGAAQQFIRVSVNDGGTGIPGPIQERIFDPCYSSKPRHEGLGLTRAHSLAGAHHGYLTVSSEPGMGSTFEVFLPVAAPVQLGTKGNSAKPSSSVVPAAVLVHAESEDVRAMLERVLAACGHRADCFGDAQGAFGAWRARNLEGTPYRAVFIGWSARGLSGAGKQLWGDILNADARARGIAVLPFGEQMSELEVTASGLYGALRSPLSVDRVARVMNEILRARTRRPA